MKTIFKTEELAHIWISQSQYEGRNASSGRENFYFSGDTIYSYGGHFPIARIITADKLLKKLQKTYTSGTVLFTSRDYYNNLTGKNSITTTKHKQAVKQAIPRSIPVFTVKDPMATYPGSHKENYCQYEKNIKDLITKASRARQYKASYLNQAENLYSEAKKYKEIFSIPGRMFNLPDIESIKADIEKNKHAEHKAAIAREKEEKIQLDFAKNVLAVWKAGKEKVVFNQPGHKNNGKEVLTITAVCVLQNHTQRQYLRIRKENKTTFIINTSLGVDIVGKNDGKLAKYVSQIYRLACKCIKTKKAYNIPPEKQVKIDRYDLRSINESGTVEIGCHTIDFSEIEYIYTRLNKAGQTSPAAGQKA